MRGNLAIQENSRSLPEGHLFFVDCSRENWARLICWAMRAQKPDGWFVSITFKTFIPESSAFKLVRIWLGRLNSAYQAKGGCGLRWILATEWQIRSVVHFHLVILGNSMDALVSRKRWELRWESLGRKTGFCRIYTADKHAAPYLAKYMNKIGDIQRGGYWRGLEAPASASCRHTESNSIKCGSAHQHTRPLISGSGNRVSPTDKRGLLSVEPLIEPPRQLTKVGTPNPERKSSMRSCP
jgi:hypothetical protein